MTIRNLALSLPFLAGMLIGSVSGAEASKVLLLPDFSKISHTPQSSVTSVSCRNSFGHTINSNEMEFSNCLEQSFQTTQPGARANGSSTNVIQFETHFQI